MASAAHETSGDAERSVTPSEQQPVHSFWLLRSCHDSTISKQAVGIIAGRDTGGDRDRPNQRSSGRDAGDMWMGCAKLANFLAD